MKLDDVYGELLQLVADAGGNIDAPIESEAFFTGLVESFVGTEAELLAYAEVNMATWFRCLDAKPCWIQEAEWPFANGKPMVFVGQLDIQPDKSGLHDHSAFFVFWDCDSGDTKVIIQVA